MALSDMRTVLDVDSNNAVTGVLSGIIKNAKRYGLAPPDVLVREQFGDEVTYVPGAKLRSEAGFEAPPLEVQEEEPH